MKKLPKHSSISMSEPRAACMPCGSRRVSHDHASGPRLWAFGLVEILVVTGVVLLLAAVAFPAVGGFMNRGKDVQCLGNMRQWGVALTTYLADSKGELPYEGAQQDPTWNQVRSPANEKAWYNVLPPYVGVCATAAPGNAAPKSANVDTATMKEPIPRCFWLFSAGGVWQVAADGYGYHTHWTI